jgi:hypothetical protein
MLIKSFWDLERIGRIRLSYSFFLRDFLQSEIGNFFGIGNWPDDLEPAIIAGRKLCTQVLEPIQETFGRVHVRSGYRSPTLNTFGYERGLKCASTVKNRGYHCWGLDADDRLGAAACIVIPWVLDHCNEPGGWQRLAWFLHDHLPYHRMVFFARQTAFNIAWHEVPERSIWSWATPRGCLTRPGMLNGIGNHGDQYQGFPAFQRPDDYLF